jgi:predicted phosphoribosyltransferase
MFRNREDGARQLAAVLKNRDFSRALVLAIPRGGVVTGAVLARELGAEFDVVLSRKLCAPDQPELAIAAISENGDVYVNEEAIDTSGVSDEYFHREKERQLALITSRSQAVRRVRPKVSMTESFYREPCGDRDR